MLKQLFNTCYTNSNDISCKVQKFQTNGLSDRIYYLKKQEIQMTGILHWLIYTQCFFLFIQKSVYTCFPHHHDG